MAEPQVKPAPKSANIRVSPRLMRPSFTAWSSASGMDAPAVFACSSAVAMSFHAIRITAGLPVGGTAPLSMRPCIVLVSVQCFSQFARVRALHSPNDVCTAAELSPRSILFGRNRMPLWDARASLSSGKIVWGKKSRGGGTYGTVRGS